MKIPKFPEPKPIDWTKYIEPIYQDFENKKSVTISITLNKEDYAIRKNSRQKNARNHPMED
jgi:hypothetical protein